MCISWTIKCFFPAVSLISFESNMFMKYLPSLATHVSCQKHKFDFLAIALSNTLLSFFFHFVRCVMQTFFYIITSPSSLHFAARATRLFFLLCSSLRPSFPTFSRSCISSQFSSLQLMSRVLFSPLCNLTGPCTFPENQSPPTVFLCN